MNEYRPQQFSMLPLAVKNILIINGILYLATYTFQSVYNIELANILGLYFPLNHHFKIWQFVTYMFMHASFDHVLFNMISFWMFGSVLENYWGLKRFLVFYFFTGIGAAICNLAANYWTFYHVQQAAQVFLNSPTPTSLNTFIASQHLMDFRNLISLNKDYIQQWLLHPDNVQLGNNIKSLVAEYSSNLANLDERFSDVMIGASGAVFGILFAYGYLFPNTLIYVYFLIPLRAKYIVALMGAYEFYSAWRSTPGDNIAHLAHLGGMLFGFILLYFWQKNNRKKFY